MKLQDQVLNLELAKRMKELGFEQESYFYFKRTIDFSDYESEQLKIGDSYDLCYDESEFCEHSSDNKISAYTVAELGEMLPCGYHTVQTQFLGWRARRRVWSKKKKKMDSKFDYTKALCSSRKKP